LQGGGDKGMCCPNCGGPVILRQTG
jgi:hypothetical protein